MVYMVYGLFAIFISMGWSFITLVLAHCVMLYTVALVKRKWICFVAGLCSLATFKMEPYGSWQVGICLEMLQNLILAYLSSYTSTFNNHDNRHIYKCGHRFFQIIV